LNRAAAVAMAHGYAPGLRLLDELEERSQLRGYYLLPAARADLLRRMGQWNSAAEAYRAALALVPQEAERKFLAGRLAEMEALAQ
jgi:RNA polymerase sigma-70 factor, ECF subfamily